MRLRDSQGPGAVPPPSGRTGRPILAILAAMLLGACARVMMEGGYLVHRLGSAGAPAVSIAALDTFVVTVGWLGPESTEAEVEARLGPPVFTRDIRGSGDTLWWRMWWYPIRDIGVLPYEPGARTQTRVVFAPRLEVFLDEQGGVERWAFVHPVTGDALEARESLDTANRWFRALEDPPRRIELEEVLRTGAPRDEVLAAMRWFDLGRPYGPDRERTLVLSGGEPGREVLTFFVDRPSALYVPPHLLQVSFFKGSAPRTSMSYQGW